LLPCYFRPFLASALALSLLFTAPDPTLPVCHIGIRPSGRSQPTRGFSPFCLLQWRSFSPFCLLPLCFRSSFSVGASIAPTFYGLPPYLAGHPYREPAIGRLIPNPRET